MLHKALGADWFIETKKAREWTYRNLSKVGL
jgi:hypothetical protein